MGRAPCCDKANVKRGPWSPEEDATLKNYIHSHGTGGNWISLPHKAGLKRCGKSCRLRWLNYLRPNIKHGGFTEEEDYIICSLYSNIGSRWSVIASRLPGRTDNDVKNYWNTKLKKKLLSGTTAGVNSMNFIQSSQSSAELSYFHQMPTLPSPPVVSNLHTDGSNNVSGSSSVGLDSWGGNGEDDELLMTLCFEASDHFLNGPVFEEQISEVHDPNLSNPPQC